MAEHKVSFPGFRGEGTMEMHSWEGIFTLVLLGFVGAIIGPHLFRAITKGSDKVTR